MAESKFILYVRKFLRNPLLARKQVALEIINPEQGTLSKQQVIEKLAKVLKAKEDCITIFGMKAKFGGGRTTAFALVYDSFDEKKKYDSKTGLKRAGLLEKPKHGRKAKKEIKGRAARVKGTAKSKVTAGKQKK